MNLKKTYNDNHTWRQVDTEELLTRVLCEAAKGRSPNDSRTPDRVEFDELVRIVARLIEYTTKTDQDTLGVLQCWDWEIDTRSDDDIYRIQMADSGSGSA